MNYRYFLIVFGLFSLNFSAFSQSEKVKMKLSENKNLKSASGSNKFSGSVYAGDNPLPEGQVYLLNKNKSSFVSANKKKLINGRFQFNNLHSGKYVLYVIPELNYDFLYFPKYIPTYFGKSYSWKKALSNNVGKSHVNISLDLLSYQDPFYGERKISGRLIFDGKFKGIDGLPVPVILFNESGSPMDFRIVDEDSGKFIFENLPEGIYSVHPEIPGLETVDYRVRIGNESNTNGYVSFIVDEEGVKIDKPDEDVIPVVSNHSLRIYLDENVNYPVVCELIDLSGKSVVKNIFYSDEVVMNTSGIATNIYILKVKTYDNFFVKTTKVFIRNY